MKSSSKNCGLVLMKKYKLIITPDAKADVASILKYLDMFSHSISSRYSTYIYDSINSLSHMPKRCTLVRDEDLREKGYRWMSVRNFTVFFIVDDNAAIVRIERVLYSKREYDVIL